MNRRSLLTVVFAILLIVTFGQAYFQHFRNALDPNVFADDSRCHIWPLYRSINPERFQNDYVGQYIEDTLPFGFRMFYRVLSPLWDPEPVSKIVPYFLLIVSMAFLGLTARTLGGRGALWFALFLGLGSSEFFFIGVGGLPRSFAIPVICMALYALAAGRVCLLASSVVLGSLLYPVVAVITGIALAGVLFVLPSGSRGCASRWTFKKRAFVLAVTAFLTLVTALPISFSSAQYGRKIRPVEFHKYPELPGRLVASEVPPYKTYWEGFLNLGQLGIVCNDRPWSEWVRKKTSGAEYEYQIKSIDHILETLLIISLIGFVLICIRLSAGRRVAVFLLASFLSFLLALIAYPHLYVPDRYVRLSAIPLMLLLLSTAVFVIPRHLPNYGQYTRRYKCLSYGLAVAILFLIGGRGPSKDSGYTVKIDPEAKIYEFLAELPDDALIAGWPDYGLTDNIPYVCKRPVLLSYETIVSYQGGYILGFRERMNALIDAYLATDVQPLKELSEKFGVTHLVIDRRHFRGAPLFFVDPFNTRIAQKIIEVQARNAEVIRQISHAGVFSENSRVVLDLSKVVRRN